jgi:hypothetical protein
MFAALWCFLQVLGAYVLVDLLTGIYHYVTDRGWNQAHIVALFQDHHVTNTMEGFDWQPMLYGLPAMVLGLWFESSFLIAAGSFGVLSQIVVSNRGDTRLKESYKKQLS